MCHTIKTVALFSTLLYVGLSTSSQDEAADWASASEVSLLQAELHVNQAVKAGRQKADNGGVQNALELEELVDDDDLSDHDQHVQLGLLHQADANSPAPTPCTTGNFGVTCRNGGYPTGEVGSDGATSGCTCRCSRGYSGTDCGLVDYNVPLITRPHSCSSPFLGYRCQKCEGNCTDDRSCVGDLKCFHRNSKDHHVPGCVAGGMSDLETHNYCYNPGDVTAFNGSLQNLGAVGCRVANSTCSKCQGDCDIDEDCTGALKCFKRVIGNETIPGCLVGGFGDVRAYDYCYDPADVTTTTANASATTHAHAKTKAATTSVAPATSTTTPRPDAPFDFFSWMAYLFQSMMATLFPYSK